MSKASVFLGYHNSVVDYPFLLSEIRQGQEGNLALRVRYSIEPQFPTWVHFPNLIIGWLSAPFKMTTSTAYNVGRAIIAFTTLIIIFKFIELYFSDRFLQVAVFAMTLFSMAFPRVIISQGNLALSGNHFLGFYSGLFPFERWAFIPHGILKDFFFILVIFFWIRFFDKRDLKQFIFAVLSGFFLGFLSPAHSIVLWGTIWLTTILILIIKPFKVALPHLKMTALYTLLTVPTSIYLLFVFRYNLQWQAVDIWELGNVYGYIFLEHALSIGPTFFLAIPAFFGTIVVFLRSGFRNFSVRQSLIFFSITLTLLFLRSSRLFHMNDMRFLGIPLPVFTGILAGQTIERVTHFLRSRINPRLLISTLVLLAIISTIPTYFLSWKSQLYMANPSFFNIYPPKQWYEGFTWLSQNSKPEDIVFSGLEFGSLAPAISGNSVYVGHPVSSLNFNKKMHDVEQFYTGTMDPNSALKLLKENGIKYVVVGIGEKMYYGANITKYNFLRLRFKTPLVEIYDIEADINH